jgi:hypothetical protein
LHRLGPLEEDLRQAASARTTGLLGPKTFWLRLEIVTGLTILLTLLCHISQDERSHFPIKSKSKDKTLVLEDLTLTSLAAKQMLRSAGKIDGLTQFYATGGRFLQEFKFLLHPWKLDPLTRTHGATHHHNKVFFIQARKRCTLTEVDRPNARAQ